MLGIGGWISALCDMTFGMEKDLLIGESAEAIDRCMPGAETEAACSSYLVRVRGANVLVDAGAGDIFDGRVHEELAKGGIAPESVDHVVLTHLHLDHVGGLLRGGEVFFPNAEVWVNEREYAFWHDDAAAGELGKRLAPSLGDGFMPTHVKVARDSLAAYGGRVYRFSGGSEGSGEFGKREILPGVTAVPLFGHTPGHCGYQMEPEAGEGAFFIFGDAVHVAAVQFALPGAGMIFDWDAGLAAESRKRAFADAAANGWLSAGMHLPFPGMGNVRNEGDAYRFIPHIPDNAVNPGA